MSLKVHLVDGTFELFRVFYGAPSARAPSGKEVGATRALLRGALALLREDGVSHVAYAFDHVIESFRNELFAGYKTGEGVEKALLAQFELAERAIHALGVVCWSMVEFEADDAIATAASRFAELPEVEQILLCSPDKDLAQCVTGARIVLCDRMRKKTFDEAGVREKFGVPPESIPDLLALVGDTADGIPGVPRWGARSAAAVLARYGHVDAIPESAGAWDVKVRGADALARSLGEHREVLPLYRKLATLRTDVPLTETLEDLRWRGARRAELEALAKELGDDGIVARVPRFLGE